MINEAIAYSDKDNHMQRSRGLERDYIQELIRSRRHARCFAGAALALATFAITGTFFVTMQPPPTPLVLRVDNATGHTDRITTLSHHEQSYGEVVDKYFINKYIQNRESYNYLTQQLYYDTTALLSSQALQEQYFDYIRGDASPLQWQDSKTIRIHITSIQLNDHGHARVRFSKKVIDHNGRLEETQHLVAVVGYHYINAPINEKDRSINPLGFQITSYQVDPENVE